MMASAAFKTPKLTTTTSNRIAIHRYVIEKQNIALDDFSTAYMNIFL